MDRNAVVANWVLDFYLRQPLEEWRLNYLLRALPCSSVSADLKKLFLLKKLEIEVSRRPVSVTALELMEQLENLEVGRGKLSVSSTMSQAYCAMAVECTLKCVKDGHDGGENNIKYAFLDAVMNIWRTRVGKIKKSAEEGGLGSDLLWDWKRTMEEAVWDDGLRESVLEDYDERIAVQAVKVYIREERENMAPSFLDLMADDRISDKGKRIMGVDLIAPVAVQDQAAIHVVPSGGGSNPCKEMQKPRNELRVKAVRRLSSRNRGGVKIADFDEDEGGPSCRNDTSPHSEEVKKAREALKLSSLELQAAVKDPLPNALQVAEAVSNETQQNKPPNPSEGNDGGPESLIVDDVAAAGVVHFNGDDVNNVLPEPNNDGGPESLIADDVAAAGAVHFNGGDVNNVPKPSLMKRNRSARSYERDESIDGSQEDVACTSAFQVPSPMGVNASPLKSYEMNNVKKRSKGRRWTNLEEDTLRAGVEQYGRGNWKVILAAYREILKGRTEVNLKDKWRNLTRSG